MGRKNMKILICDDENRDALSLKVLCEICLNKEQPVMEYDVSIATSAITIENFDPDILILDVDMPDRNGILVKDELCKKGVKTLIIFVTNHKEAMPRAFGRNVIGFIEKPVDSFHLETALKCAFNLLPKEIVIHTDNRHQVNSENIVYIRSERIYTELFLVSGEIISNQRKPLRAWKEEFVNLDFLQIHESYLVNCRYIDDLCKSEVVLANGMGTLPISRARRSLCIQAYKNYCKRQARLI